MPPTVIAYNEIYNTIQNGVISAGENEAAGVEPMKLPMQLGTPRRIVAQDIFLRTLNHPPPAAARFAQPP
jgi:hypothetical protein